MHFNGANIEKVSCNIGKTTEESILWRYFSKLQKQKVLFFCLFYLKKENIM